MGKTQEHWTVEDFKKYQNKQTIRKDPKYRAKKTRVDGHIFASIKEAEYYEELKLRQKAGEIKGFCIQPIFILAPELRYIADFIVFNNDGTTDIIDTKGIRNKEYIVKKKVFEDKFDLKITEV